MIDGIYGFEEEYSFLSNFYPSPILIAGHLFPTVEHAYQAHKATNEQDFILIRDASNPGIAKQLAKILQKKNSVIPDWHEIKVSVMSLLLEEKFKIPALRTCLINTGTLYLEETNYWNDTFWGVCRGKGKNTLGLLLMDIRKGILES